MGNFIFFLSGVVIGAAICSIIYKIKKAGTQQPGETSGGGSVDRGSEKSDGPRRTV